MSLRKCVYDLYAKNYKREIKDGLTVPRDRAVSVKMSVPKLSYIFNSMQNKTTAVYIIGF